MNERRDKIKAYITEKVSVRVNDLAEMFPGISLMTIRRDLAALEEEGAIIRTRGGARLSLQPFGRSDELLYSHREISNVPGKNAIAAKAMEFLQEKRSIFFDSGTTIMALAHKVPDKNLILFTSAPNTALEIVLHTQKPQVTLLGGSLARNTLSCSGRLPLEYLRSINLDIAFMATSAFSLQSGFSSGNPYESELKAEVIRKSQQVIMLMTADKIGHSMPYTFANLSDVDVLICDRELDGEMQEAAAKHNILVL